MNTKTEQISSGLVAVAEVAFSHHLGLYAAFVGRRQIEVGDKLVRLSDAEAIISAKDAEIAESDHIRDRCAHLLAETAVALKGPEKALHRHGWQDLPEVAAKQSAALKLAREALFDMQDSYAAVHGWKDSFVIAATTAIAAIDEVLKGE